VYARSGPTWGAPVYLKASNADPGDLFGASLALSADGSTLAVSAVAERSGATGIDGIQNDNSRMFAGAVYVFTRSGMTWSQQAYIKASNTSEQAVFGLVVALSGNGSTLAVTAPGEASAATGINGPQNDGSAPEAGAAYVFTRAGTTWSQQAYLKASNAESHARFGSGLGLSRDGNFLAVGAETENCGSTGINGDQHNPDIGFAGAAYVFKRTAGTWHQQAYIKASNTETFDGFGRGIALSADGATLAVTANGESSAATGVGGDQSDNSSPAAGAAYVFTRSGATWQQQAYIKASNPDPFDNYGVAVTLSADGATLLVSSPYESSGATGFGGDQSDNGTTYGGAVYRYTRSGTTWSQQAYVKASNTAWLAGFGSAMALSDDGTMVVGAGGESSAATGLGGDQSDQSALGAGAVYVFR
jgi:hypothetical protein